MTDKVVAFPGSEGVPDCPITIQRPPSSLCRHDRITLDEHNRSVRCNDCQQVFDAFSYLLSNARSITRAWSDYRSMMQRLEEKASSVEALAKEEKRLKARLKTIKEKAEPSIDIKGRYL